MDKNKCLICQRFEVDSVLSGDAYYDRSCHVCWSVGKKRARDRIYKDQITMIESGLGFNECWGKLHQLEILEMVAKKLFRVSQN